MRAWLIAIAMLFAAASPAQAEPISTFIGLSALIGGALEGIGIGAAVATSLGGAIGGAFVGGAITIGLSFAATALAPKPPSSPQLGFGDFSSDTGGAARANTTEVRYTTRQGAAPKRVTLGTGYVGGVLFIEKVKPPYLVHGILLNHGEIAAVEKIWIGTNELVLAGIAEGQILTPLAGISPDGTHQPNYQDRLQISLGYGSSTQTLDPLLAQEFPDLDANFRQQGIARAVFRYDFGADADEFRALWGNAQYPSAFLLVQGVKVYDPRDPSQDLDDEDTWVWSNNATLIQAYYLTRDWGGRIATSRIDWVKVAEAADYDDEAIPCADGTWIRRYTIDGVVQMNQRPVDVMTGLLTANRGHILQSGGMIWPTSSKPRAPAWTIDDAILAGGISYTAAKPKRDLINKLLTRFIAEEQDYQLTDGPVLSDTDLQAEDGEVLTGTLSLPFTLDHRRAQRLAKAFLATARLGRTITCRVAVEFLARLNDELVGSSGNFHSDLFPQANGVYLCLDVGLADDGATLELQLVQYDPDIELDWDAATDEQDFMLADLDLAA